MTNPNLAKTSDKMVCIGCYKEINIKEYYFGDHYGFCEDCSDKIGRENKEANRPVG
jgi:rRNA maturation endonuclease Nob1